jgi:hypothetical protein
VADPTSKSGVAAPQAVAEGAALRQILLLALGAAALITAAYHLACELRTLSLTEPMGMWETSYAAVARVWPHEYQFGSYVSGHDNYGPGFPAFCRPFLAAIGDVYVAQRVANLAALAGACLVLALILRGNGCGGAECAAVAAIFYSLFEGSYSVQARPDFLLALLILAVLGVGQPRFWQGRNPILIGLALGALSLAAYLTKPYGLLSYAIAAGSMAYWGPRRWAAKAVGSSALLFAGGLWAYASANPYYFFETFTALRASTHVDAAWFGSQLRDFVVLSFGVIAVSVLALKRGTWERGGPGVAYWAFGALAGCAALLLGPAWHPGSYLTYYFHLLLPQLCVLAAIGCSEGRSPGAGWPWRHALLAANLCVLMATAPEPPRADPGWKALAEDVRRQQGPVVVDFLMEPLVRGRADAMVLGSGMTAFALAEPSTVGNPGDIGRRAAAEAQAYESAMRSRLTGSAPPRAIYIETLLMPAPGRGDLRRMAPRGGLAYLLGTAVGGYRSAAIFRIHPYGLSTNTPRHLTGRWESYVVKMVPPAP